MLLQAGMLLGREGRRIGDDRAEGCCFQQESAGPVTNDRLGP